MLSSGVFVCGPQIAALLERSKGSNDRQKRIEGLLVQLLRAKDLDLQEARQASHPSLFFHTHPPHSLHLAKPSV